MSLAQAVTVFVLAGFFWAPFGMALMGALIAGARADDEMERAVREREDQAEVDAWVRAWRRRMEDFDEADRILEVIRGTIQPPESGRGA